MVMNKALIAIGIIVLTVGGLWALQYEAVFDAPTQPGEVVDVALPEDSLSAQDSTDEAFTASDVSYSVERVVDGLDIPWSVVFTSDERLLVSERPGDIRAVVNDTLQTEPLYTFTDVSSQDEEGVMGMVLDPLYTENSYLYVCYAYGADSGLAARVVRLTDEGDSLTEQTTIIEDIPAARFHAGCRLGFGPDNTLYITTGDSTDKQLAQDLNSLAGKILRLNADGTIPEDNPFAGSPVYSYGHRNPQGISWHPESGVLISTEHGPSVFDGPAGGDEVNRIEPGNNYGWPLVSHDDNQEGLVAPLIQFTPAEAPASALIYSGTLFAPWYGNLFFGALVGEGIMRIEFTDAQATAVASYEKLDINVGRVREVMQGPDGAIYFTTSNTDGRGEPSATDDTVYRLVPSN